MTPPSTAAPSAAAALALIKPEVRALAGYTLTAPPAPRKLNQNESPYDAPAAVKDAVLARVRETSWNRYPAFTPTDLLARLASRHDWMPDGVLVGNGSNELIQATLAVAVGPGTAVVTPVPTFALYQLLTTVYGGRHVAVPLRADFAFDLDALVAAVRRTSASVVVVNSPNNPTGTPLPEGGAQRLLEDTDALVVLDEAYQDFGGPTAVPLLAGHPRLVVLRTFSKAKALAGLRFGYALAHPDLAREIAKAKLPYNVNHVTLAAAAAALDAAPAMDDLVRRVRIARDRLATGLALIPGLRAYPTAANFVLVRCVARTAQHVFQALVERHGILVRDVSAGPGLEDCLRITAGTDDDVDAVLTALKTICGGEV
jgi:histidinol-phosphate aminotransferase